MNELWYVATGTFSSANPGWSTFQIHSAAVNRSELVSLDCVLCPFLIETVGRADSDLIVTEFPYRYFFKELQYVLDRTGDVLDKNILAVVFDPVDEQAGRLVSGFVFMGYDLVDPVTGKSILVSSVSYPRVLNPEILNTYGLIPVLSSVQRIKQDLQYQYPEDPRTQTDIWAVWRMER